MSNVVRFQQQAAMPAISLPANIDLEQGFLGALMRNNRIYQKVGSGLRPEHFFEPVHEHIYRVVGEVIAAGGVASPVTLKTYLGDKDLGDGVTPMAYLARLAAEACVDSSAVSYAKEIAALAARRKMIQATETVRALATDAPVGMSPAEMLAQFEGLMEEIRPAMGGRMTGFEPFGVVVRRAMQSIEDDWKNVGVSRSLSTGFPALDEKLGGLEAPNFIIIGGRPGMAKTGLVMNIAVNVAGRLAEHRAEGHKTGVVAFFSLEMSAEQLAERTMAARASLAAFRVKRRKSLTEKDIERLANTERDVSDLPIMIDQTGEIPIATLLTRARDLHRRHGIALLCIDYMQLIAGFDARAKDANRQRELSQITSALKALAKELHIPIIALAQVSRDVDKRPDRRPMKADLRESGSLEQDADQILFIYRHEYYLAQEKPLDRAGADALAKWEREMRACEGVAEIIIDKQRHGPTGTVTMGYDAKRILFLNEPEPREVEPEEVRQRAAKRPTFTAEGTVLYGILKSLTLTKSRIATNEQRAADKRLCKGARLIPLDDARQAFGNEVLPGSDDEKVNTRFRAAFVSLRKAEIAFYHGTQETGFSVWLPELAADL